MSDYECTRVQCDCTQCRCWCDDCAPEEVEPVIHQVEANLFMTAE